MRGIAVTAGILGASLALSAAAGAATFKPTRFDDPPPGKCKPNDCSLREAITKANEHPGGDEIALSSGHYRIELPDDNNDTNLNGDFDVTDKVLIRGKGPRRTIVDGRSLSGVFSLLTFSPHELRGLTVEGGRAQPPEAGSSPVPRS